MSQLSLYFLFPLLEMSQLSVNYIVDKVSKWTDKQKWFFQLLAE